MIHGGRTLALAAALWAPGWGEAAAQVPATPRELGMGGAYAAAARGHQAIFLSPANLALSDGPRWSLGVGQLALAGTLLGPTLADLPDLGRFQELPSPRQEEILASIPASGLEGRFSFRAPLATYSSGSFGLGLSYTAVGGQTLSRDLAELLLRGYEEGRTDYSVGNTLGTRASFWNLAASYARRVGDYTVGVTGHHVRGGTLTRTRLFEPRVDLEARDLEVDYVGVVARGGRGVALDAGAAYQPAPHVTLSATLSNLFARMSWSEELRLRQLTLDRSLIEDGASRELWNRYERSEVPFDPTGAPLHGFETAEGLYEEAYFPAVARLGLAWRVSAETELTVDHHRKLTDGWLGESWERRWSIGLEQRLPVVTLRAGLATSREAGSLLAGGVSLGPLEVGVARFRDGEVAEHSRDGWIGALGISLKQQF